jgi:opacity protein-like surface antigen
VAGAGLEYKLTGHLLLRAEYLHYGFGTVNNQIESGASFPYVDSHNALTTVDTVRGGLRYKF